MFWLVPKITVNQYNNVEFYLVSITFSGKTGAPASDFEFISFNVNKPRMFDTDEKSRPSWRHSSVQTHRRAINLTAWKLSAELLNSKPEASVKTCELFGILIEFKPMKLRCDQNERNNIDFISPLHNCNNRTTKSYIFSVLYISMTNYSTFVIICLPRSYIFTSFFD